MQKVEKLSGCGIFKIARITSVSLDSEEILKMARRYRAALRVIYAASKATPQRLREIAYRAFMHDDNKPLPNKKRVRLTPEMKRCLALIEPQGFIVDASPKDIAIYMKAMRRIEAGAPEPQEPVRKVQGSGMHRSRQGKL